MKNIPAEPVKRRPSLRDVAKVLGLSHVSVSLALRDSVRVSKDNREKIKAMAEQMGYRPDPMLASLAAYRRGKRQVPISACIAWINQWDEPEGLRAFKEFELYWQGATEAAERLGYKIEEFRWPVGKSCRRLQAILETRGVRGLLIPPHRVEPLLVDLDLSRFALVRLGASVTKLPAHMVASDQSHCARLAYRKAFEYGYLRIGYVSYPGFEHNTGGHFCEGYLNAQMEIAPPKSRLVPFLMPTEVKNRGAALKKWLNGQRPDALLATLPELGVILDRLGLHVPDDIAVAAMSVLDGNFDSGADQNSREIGRVAVNVLAGLLLENEPGLPRFQRRTLVEGRWVDGRSMPKRNI